LCVNDVSAIYRLEDQYERERENSIARLEQTGFLCYEYAPLEGAMRESMHSHHVPDQVGDSLIAAASHLYTPRCRLCRRVQRKYLSGSLWRLATNRAVPFVLKYHAAPRCFFLRFFSPRTGTANLYLEYYVILAGEYGQGWPGKRLM